MSEAYVEPWMRGHYADLHPTIAALLYSFEHARDDLAKWTEGLDGASICASRGKVASVAFHIAHIAGSIERLIAYAKGEQLSDQQLAELRAEKMTSKSRSELLELLEEKTRAAEVFLRALDPSELTQQRYIGRKRIATTLGVLLIHIAEHTQRHVGEAILTTKILRGDYL